MTGLYELPELYDAQYDTYRDDLHFFTDRSPATTAIRCWSWGRVPAG